MAQSVGRLRGLHPVVDTRDWVYAGAKKVLKVAQRAPMEVSRRPRPWTVQRRLPAACWETFSASFGPPNRSFGCRGRLLSSTST